MGKAIEYTYTLLPRLSRYVNDGRIETDDNRIENAIRPLALVRLCSVQLKEEKTICYVGTTYRHIEQPLYTPLSRPASLPELTLECGWRTY